jgi:hypothetical protein
MKSRSAIKIGVLLLLVIVLLFIGFIGFRSASTMFCLWPSDDGRA